MLPLFLCPTRKRARKSGVDSSAHWRGSEHVLAAQKHDHVGRIPVRQHHVMALQIPAEESGGNEREGLARL